MLVKNFCLPKMYADCIEFLKIDDVDVGLSMNLERRLKAIQYLYEVTNGLLPVKRPRTYFLAKKDAVKRESLISGFLCNEMDCDILNKCDRLKRLSENHRVLVCSLRKFKS